MMFTIVISSVLIFVVWQLAAKEVTPEIETLQEQVRFLSADLDSLNSRLKRAQARQVVLEQEAAVLRKANRLLREHESGRQAELGRMKTELEFYGRLAGIGGALSGLDLYQVEILPTASERVFQFILTLTQNIRRAAIVSGHARIKIEGTVDDRPVTLTWAQVSDEGTPDPAFRFKYFQQLEGYLTLPEGFSPTRLLVTLESDDRKQPVTRHYNWNELGSY